MLEKLSAGAGAAIRSSVFLGAGAIVGAADRAWQSTAPRSFIVGGMGGAVSWLAGGMVLYSFVFPSIDEFATAHLIWHFSFSGVVMYGWYFSLLSILAGLVCGLVLGVWQTWVGVRAPWGFAWPIISMLAAALAWALVPAGVATI